MKRILFLIILILTPISSFADEMDEVIDFLYEEDEETETLIDYLDNDYYLSGNLKQNIRDNMELKAGKSVLKNISYEQQEEVLKSLEDTIYILENIDESGIYNFGY